MVSNSSTSSLCTSPFTHQLLHITAASCTRFLRALAETKNWKTGLKSAQGNPPVPDTANTASTRETIILGCVTILPETYAQLQWHILIKIYGQKLLHNLSPAPRTDARVYRMQLLSFQQFCIHEIHRIYERSMLRRQKSFLVLTDQKTMYVT